MCDITRLDIAGEPVHGVVGQLDDLVLGLVGQDRQDGTEDLLAGDGHLRRHVGEHRRLHVVATLEALGATGAACDEGRSLPHARFDQPLDLVELGLAHHGPDHRVSGLRRTDLDRLRRLPRHRHRVVVLFGVHEHPRGSVAGLTAVAEAVLHAIAHRLLEVGVGQDDIGRLAPQLLVHALHGVGRRLGDEDARPCRSREGHEVHPGMSRNGLTDGGAVAVDEIEHALGHTGRVHHLGEEDGVEGSDFARLQHHGAAGGEGRGDLAHDLVDRPVPGGDEAAHPDGLAHDEGTSLEVLELVGLQNRDHLVEMAQSRGGLGLGGEEGGRPHLHRDGLGDVVVACLVRLDDALEEGDPLLSRGVGVGGEGGPCRFHRAVDVGGRAQADLRHGFFGGGVDHVESAGRDGIDPGAVDIELEVVTHGHVLL